MLFQLLFIIYNIFVMQIYQTQQNRNEKAQSLFFV